MKHVRCSMYWYSGCTLSQRSYDPKVQVWILCEYPLGEDSTKSPHMTEDAEHLVHSPQSEKMVVLPQTPVLHTLLCKVIGSQIEDDVQLIVSSSSFSIARSLSNLYLDSIPPPQDCEQDDQPDHGYK